MRYLRTTIAAGRALDALTDALTNGGGGGRGPAGGRWG